MPISELKYKRQNGEKQASHNEKVDRLSAMATYKKSIEMRSNILKAAEKLVLEKGYGKTTITDISEELEVPRSLVYYYFKDKKDIMRELYQERFQAVDEMVLPVMPQGKDPMVRLILKYLIFRREVLQNPLFTEFISESEFAALNMDSSEQQVQQYYADSRDAFEYCGKSAQSKEFRVHVRVLEGVARALIMAEYHQTLELTDWEAMTYLGKYVIIPTFELTQEEYRQILTQAFELAEQLKEPAGEDGPR